MLSRISQLTSISIILLLAGCASAPGTQTTSAPANAGRYEMDKDSGVLESIDLSKVRQVVPRVENRTLAGNKSPYTVNGVSYKVLSSEAGYSETGVASWYGRKFHGHLTSNGEIYDMFQLSAAHTSLPIPSYAKVTNLDNGKSIVVRVNDRGPFHSTRIIDLSYAAAVMLGYADTGTARVRVEAAMPATLLANSSMANVATAPLPTPEPPTVEEEATEKQRIEAGEGNEYLQVGAFANMDSARSLAAQLNAITSMDVVIHTDVAPSGATLHKVRVGPLANEQQAQQLVDNVKSANLGNPFRVRI